MKSHKQIDPIAQLMQEHDAALTHLSALSRATRSLSQTGFNQEDFRTVLIAVEFIGEEVSTHNKNEEEALFPVLERYIEGPTKIMRDDHKLMRKDYLRLRKSVAKLGKYPEKKSAAEELEETARSVVQRFVNHIHKENHILFPLVQKFLTKDALREVARRLI